MEAARIDGASEFRLFFRVVLPLGLPAIAALAIFQVLFVWNDLLIGLVMAQTNQPIAPTIASQLRQFGSNLDVHRAGRVLLGGDPPDDLRALPALLRPGAAGRLRQVGRGRAVRHRRRGARRLRRLRDLAPRRPRARRDRRLRGLRGPRCGVARARGGDPPGAHALRERRPLLPDDVPGARRTGGRASADLAPLLQSVCNRYRPTVVAFLRHVDELRERSGWDESVRPARIERVRADECGFGSTATAPSGTSCSRRGIPGSPCRPELEGDPRVVHAYEPHEYASTVAVRRGRHGRGDRVAERARRRRRGRLDPPPRAGAPAAQRAAAALLETRSRRAPRCLASGARRAPPRLLHALVSARPRVGRADRPGGARGQVPRRAGAERRRSGHLRDGLPQRLPARPAPPPARRGARARHGGPLDRPRRRLLGARRSRPPRGRSRSPASPPSGHIRRRTRSSG